MESKFHLICLRCRKQTITIRPKLYMYLGYERCSYCNKCLRKGLDMLLDVDRKERKHD